MSHLDLDALADALAAESDGAPLPEHVTGCAECAAQLDALRAALPAVASDLAGLPDVPALPSSLSRSVVPTPGTSSTTVLPTASLDEARARKGRGLLAVSGFAAAAVLVVGGGLLLTHNATDTGSRATAAKSGRTSVPTTSSGTDYTKASLPAALPRLLGVKDTAVGAAAPSGSPTPESQSGVKPRLTTNGVDPLARLRAPAALAACIASLTGPDDPSLPLALDYASFDGKPALIVLLPDVKPSKVDFWVVGPACTQTESALLYYVRLDRPT